MINFNRIFVLTLILYIIIQEARTHYAPIEMTGRYVTHGMADEALNKARIATKFDAVNWSDLDRYGRQMDRPLLVKYVGPATDLYAAMAPKRSFLGTIDGGFYRDGQGKIIYRDDAAIGAIAV